MKELNDRTKREPGAECRGRCANSDSNITVITTTCEIKDEKPNWYHNETILDGTTVNTTYEKECFKCRDFPDKDGIFKWNCTFTEVLLGWMGKMTYRTLMAYG